MHDSPPQLKGGVRNRLVADSLPRTIDTSMDREELTPHRSKSGIRNATEVLRQVVDGPLAGSIEKEGLQLSIRPWIYADAGVPFRLTAAFRCGARR